MRRHVWQLELTLRNQSMRWKKRDAQIKNKKKEASKNERKEAKLRMRRAEEAKE